MTQCKTYSAKHTMCLCGMPHGDVETFTAHGCKCRPCREAGTSTSTSMSMSTSVTTTTQALVRKKNCPAYDLAAKACRCGNAHGSRSTYGDHACRCEACRGAQREHKRQYYAANVGKIREYDRQRRAANPEKVRERQRQWQQNNPDKVSAKNQRRRATKNAAPGNLHDTTTCAWWFGEMVNLYRACPVCEVPFDESERATTPSLDHIVPLVKGGHHDTSNGTILCQACNGSKSDSDMDTWLARRREALGLPPLD